MMKKEIHYCDICRQKVIKQYKKQTTLQKIGNVLKLAFFEDVKEIIGIDYYGIKTAEFDACAECHKEYKRWEKWRQKTVNLNSIKSKNTTDKNTQE